MKTSDTIQLSRAVALEIGALNQPVVTLYDISVIISKLYGLGSYKGRRLAYIKKGRATRADCTRTVNFLLEHGILEQSSSVAHSEVFSVLGREHAPPGEIICSIDPFAYVSHLTAMEWHGLTDRIGHTLFYSSPPPKRWRVFASDKMKKDAFDGNIGHMSYESMPVLKRINVKKIGKMNVRRYLSDHLGAFLSVQDRCLRVSAVGRTFLDMIREPDFCGGIYHVLDVYEEYGARYNKIIIDEVDRHGTQIDKIRVGYILEERMGLGDPKIDGWKKFVQRGGSRKLYSKKPYSVEFSDKWCLSINIE